MKATAILNLKEQPNTLTVSGSVPTPHEKDTVHLEVAEPQGINPTILLLNLVVNVVPGPMKMTEKTFSSTYTDNVSRYKEVQINYEGRSVTIPVEILG